MVTFRQFIVEQFDAPPPSKPAIVQPAPRDKIGNLIQKYVKPNREDEIGNLIQKYVKPNQEQEFNDFIKRTFNFEGKTGKITTDTGGLTKYGISQKSNPDLSDEQIKNLTPEQATKIYRERYYDELGDLTHLGKKSRAIIYDASVNHGPTFAKNMAKRIGNNPEKLLQHRKEHYDNLVLTDPTKYGKYHKGWMNRLYQLRDEINQMKD